MLPSLYSVIYFKIDSGRIIYILVISKFLVHRIFLLKDNRPVFTSTKIKGRGEDSFIEKVSYFAFIKIK